MNQLLEQYLKKQETPPVNQIMPFKVFYEMRKKQKMENENAKENQKE